MNETPASPSAPVPQAVRVALPSLVPTVTYAILGFTVFVYVLQLLSVAIFDGVDLPVVFGARLSDLIRAGQVWRFVTPVFLHASPTHIFFNMYALFSFGSFLEKQYGHVRFMLLYFLGAFSGNVFSFLLTGGEGYSIGASTAVFGLIVAELIFFYQNQKLFGNYAKQAIGNAVFFIVINLFIGLMPRIDGWGHVGGLLGGAMFAWFSSPRWEVVGISPDFRLQDQREFREIVLGAGMVIIIFGGLAVWGMF